MNNNSKTLADYENCDVIPAISSIVVTKGTSKSGMDYHYLSINYKNGFTQRLFTRRSELFGLLDAMKNANISCTEIPVQQTSSQPQPVEVNKNPATDFTSDPSDQSDGYMNFNK